MSSPLMNLLKPQLDGLMEMYRNGYKAGLAEGRRQAMAEMAKDITKIQENFHDEATATL